MRHSVVFLTAFALVHVASFAQTTGTIVGTVTDTSSAVVPKTIVTATNAATGLRRVTDTNQSGNYVLPLLPVGSYEITAEVAGFKKNTITGVVLEVNQQARVDIVLEVGAVTETVSISSQTIALQTENAVVGQVVDNR